MALSDCPQMPQNAACAGSLAPQLGQLYGDDVVMYLVPWKALLFYHWVAINSIQIQSFILSYIEMIAEQL